jgi:hypothetical protein
MHVEALRSMVQVEKPLLSHGGLGIYAEDLAYILGFLKRYPRLSRTEVIGTLCEHLQWLTPAGGPRLVAGSLLLARLEQLGEICLPAWKENYRAQPGRVLKPRRGLEPVARGEPVRASLAQLGPVRLRLLREVHEEAQCNAHLASFHPLGYFKPFGFWARYRIEAAQLGLGYLLLSGPARRIQARDNWIGWSEPQRRRNLPWVVNNNRFLIFPWVSVAHLASHVLGQLARQLADDWQARWGFAPLLLESFVDPAHYRGTCYRAAGWQLLGHTSGDGLARPGKDYRSSPKLIFVKPLSPRFRDGLCSDQLYERPTP